MTKANEEIKNEIAGYEPSETSEVVEQKYYGGDLVIREEENFLVVQDAKGKFARKAKYKEYNSVPIETKADKIWLFNLFEGAEGSGIGLKEMVGKEIEVAHIITHPYDTMDEDNGYTTIGVLTYLIDPNKTVYVTSSKNVYFTIVKNMELFGKPTDADWENIKFSVYDEKADNGRMVKIKMIG